MNRIIRFASQRVSLSSRARLIRAVMDLGAPRDFKTARSARFRIKLTHCGFSLLVLMTANF